MIESVLWYERQELQPLPALAGEIEADAVVVGGGIAGLSAARFLMEAGQKVVVLERAFCGAGATGKSSGFITPDSELELQQLCRRFGDGRARVLWRAAEGAVEQIRRTVEAFAIDCEYLPAASLYVANTSRAARHLQAEHEAHRRLGFASRFRTGADLARAVGARGYVAGIETDGTFAINGHLYAQGLKRALTQRGVLVFEGTAVSRIGNGEVATAEGRVRAPPIFVCMDRFAPEVGLAKRDDYHAQTFLAVTDPLPAEILSRIFPEGAKLVWDTDLIYQYFRPTVDGRLLVGGGSLMHTYRGKVSHDAAVTEKLRAYVEEKLPCLRGVPGGVTFSHWWPGMIGVSKDLLPIAGAMPGRDGVFFAMCGAGLPWSVLAAETAVRCALEGDAPLAEYFRPKRAFTVVEPLQPVLRRAATFALSHYVSKNLGRGDACSVRRQQWAVRAALAAMAGVAAGLLVGSLLKGRQQLRPAR